MWRVALGKKGKACAGGFPYERAWGVRELGLFSGQGFLFDPGGGQGWVEVRGRVFVVVAAAAAAFAYVSMNFLYNRLFSQCTKISCSLTAICTDGRLYTSQTLPDIVRNLATSGR